MLAVYNTLKINGTPKKLIIVSAIASSFAIESLKSQLPPNTEFWLGAIDDELTAQSYIVPGLGDAGDLAFGIKV
jgi:uracil phosphoribosyltransferase